MSREGKEFWRREATKCRNRDAAVTGQTRAQLPEASRVKVRSCGMRTFEMSV